MMKYLPGDGIREGSGVLTRAKGEMLNDWKKEVARAINETHNKLNDLGINKVKDVVKVSEGILEKTGIEKREETKEDKTGKALESSAFLDLKQLMRDLDLLYQQHSSGTMHFNKVPIYSVAKSCDKQVPRTMNLPFSWWRPVCTLAQMADMPRNSALDFLKNDKQASEILQDFVAVQSPYKTLLEEWMETQATAKKTLCKIAPKKDMKKPRRGSKSLLKMKERKEQKQRKQYDLKEYETNGQKHYLVVRKEAKNTTDDVEDIFADWKKNFAAIKRPRSLKPRVRKISHRQERKELLKQAEETKVEMGPLTYSQMLKKGLRLPKEQDMVEDIFQNWRLFLEELTDIVAEKEDKKESVDELDFFKVWKHNLHVPVDRVEDLDILSSTHPTLLPYLDCGLPTVRNTVITKTEPNAATLTPTKTTTKKNVEIAKQLTKPVRKSSKSKSPIEKKDNPNNIPIPPPPPPPPVQKPYEAVKKNMQIMPFVEKKPIKISSPPSPVTKDVIPLPDQTKKPDVLKPIADFKPSAHSQRLLTPMAGEQVKAQLTAEQIYEFAKDASHKPNWQNLLLPNTETSRRGENRRKLPSKPEEVFQSWRYIFTEENIKNKEIMKSSNKDDDLMIFKEWAEFNLKEPEARKRRESEMEESPKATKKEVRKFIKTENIEEDMIELKENRRHDFARNASIKDKKRGEASRKSLGKRIK